MIEPDTARPKRTPRGPSPQKTQATRRSIVAAAFAEFLEHGYARGTTASVAQRAGLSKVTLFRYFDSKEALFKAVIEEGIVPALAAAEQQMASFSGSAAVMLRSLLIGWWQQIGSTRLGGIAKLIISESRNFPEVAQYYHDRVIARGRSLLRAALKRGIDAGEFRPMNVESCIDVAIAPLLMLAIWRHSFCYCGNDIDPRVYLDTHVDLLVNGLLVREDKA